MFHCMFFSFSMLLRCSVVLGVSFQLFQLYVNREWAHLEVQDWSWKIGLVVKEIVTGDDAVMDWPLMYYCGWHTLQIERLVYEVSGTVMSSFSSRWLVWMACITLLHKGLFFIAVSIGKFTTNRKYNGCKFGHGLTQNKGWAFGLEELAHMHIWNCY